MKQKISFLAMIAFALNVNYVCASECIGEDCEIEPMVIEQNIEANTYLEPVRYEINWFATANEEETYCEQDYNCPFETAAECAIWYKKPVHKTSLEPRAPHINPVLVDDMLYALHSYRSITANDSEMAPLLQRYKMLMNASNVCCTSGIVYKMQKNHADELAVYEFLKDDANYFATSRCMVMPDEEISREYSNGVNGKMLADVRNSCLCKNRQWFTNLLQPFKDIYERYPDFQKSPFTYKYIDGMQREISVSVNEEVQTALGLLSACPD